MEIRLLLPGDDRSAFRSGDDALDRFFRQYAGQNQFRHRVGVTYVALVEERIVGFATVAPAVLEARGIPAALARRLPAYPLPVLRLARLATEATMRSRGVGLALLRYVLQLAVSQSEAVGCVGVIVDAKPDAIAFYRRYGFVVLDTDVADDEGEPTTLFLSISSIAPA